MHNHHSIKKILALTTHYVYSVRRNPARLIEIFLWPTFELFIFLLLARGITQSAESHRQGLIIGSGLVFWLFSARIIQESIAQFVDDFFSGNIQHILIAPIKLWELYVSIFIAATLKLAASYAVLLIIIALMQQSGILSLLAHGALWIGILIFFGCGLTLIALSFIFLYGQRVSFIGWIMSTLIQIFSCVYYPREALPGILKLTSYVIPSSYVFESIRSFVLLGHINYSGIYTALLLCGLYLILGLTLARISYRYGQHYGTFTKT